ncbi:ABC transporter ATP-binding protein [Actinocorallia longicatena]|uniref:ABC transporter ATP-binding protein n=1 Tax=Actinocorallia longicatena TaxID=111803 RepID=A0ABP6QHM3_9ACTN
MKGAGTLLSFTDVTRRFGGVPALEAVTLTVGRGEFVSVVGPSGCGKSTLLRLASGLDVASSGAVETATDEVAYVFQDATLMPWRTVRRNVELLAELSGAGRGDVRERARAALESVGLAEFAGHLPRQLSGGMRMRASLARALVMKPALFLFDEPFGALDEITRTRLNLQLLDLFVERGFGALFVTHSVEESVFLSGRVVVMSARPGRITAEFAVPFPYPRPAALRYTAEFAELAGKVAAALEEAS